MRGMDVNPYRSPQVPAAPPPPWTPNYRSAAFGSVGLVVLTLTVAINSATAIRQYALQGTADHKHLAGVAVAGAFAVLYVYWVWAALRYGKRC
jgi:hypothetical protein